MSNGYFRQQLITDPLSNIMPTRPKQKYNITGSGS